MGKQEEQQQYGNGEKARAGEIAGDENARPDTRMMTDRSEALARKCGEQVDWKATQFGGQ
jgi:hypothetical protein